MPKAWLCIPSARSEADSTVHEWLNAGYGIALWKDGPGPTFERDPGRITVWHPQYPGYSQSVNRLSAMVFEFDPVADWVICAGDDTQPDFNHTPDELAAQLSNHFGGTLGVCQFTGDRFANGSIDRIAGSPWIGREFARRVNRGKGPYWPEYKHNFCDNEIMQVAIKHGVFLQRRDLIHLHRHFTRESDALDALSVRKPIPPHLTEAFSPAGWDKYKAIFESRKAAGFPGSELL